MKRLQVLRRVLRETGADKIWTGFLVQFFLSAAVIWLREPDMPRYGDALWYCYAVITTVGFGDVLVTTHLARVISVILSIYAVLVIAIITGVVVNYFNQIVQMRQSETMESVLDKLEHLSEMSREDLEELSKTVKKLRRKR